jgi:RNA polymerase sigma factor (sigma-70 family)
MENIFFASTMPVFPVAAARLPTSPNKWAWMGRRPLWRVFMKDRRANSVFKRWWSGWLISDRRVFDRYYQPCHQQLTMFCLGWLKDLEMAENVASDALMKLLEQPDPQAIEHIDRWLFTAAKRQCLTLLDQQRRRQGILDGLTPALAGRTPAASDEGLRAEELRRLMREALSEREYEVWRLHEEGYDNAEIAGLLDVSEKTAANIKAIARQKLRTTLNHTRHE